MFNQALDVILKFEGGFVDDPVDPGGRTNYGITQSEYDPTKEKDVKEITKAEVSNIYQRDYWLEGDCDEIDKINPNLALVHFDCCVNCGVVTANKMLQEILGVEKDGIIGPKILLAIKRDNSQIALYLDRRKLYYDRVIEHQPKLIKFRSSWYHRLNKLATYSSLNWSASNAS